MVLVCLLEVGRLWHMVSASFLFLDRKYILAVVDGCAEERRKSCLVGISSNAFLGGPASLLLAFSLTGVMMYCTVQALGELAVLFPVAGSFAAYSTRFLDPAWGFAMGWNYAMQWLVVLPLEIVSASITVDYWVSG